MRRADSKRNMPVVTEEHLRIVNESWKRLSTVGSARYERHILGGRRTSAGEIVPPSTPPLSSGKSSLHKSSSGSDSSIGSATSSLASSPTTPPTQFSRMQTKHRQITATREQSEEIVISSSTFSDENDDEGMSGDRMVDGNDASTTTDGSNHPTITTSGNKTNETLDATTPLTDDSCSRSTGFVSSDSGHAGNTIAISNNSGSTTGLISSSSSPTLGSQTGRVSQTAPVSGPVYTSFNAKFKSPLVYFFEVFFTKLNANERWFSLIFENDLQRKSKFLGVMMRCMLRLRPEVEYKEEVLEVATHNFRLGVMPEHYETIMKVLLITIGSVTGYEEYTADVSTAWGAVVDSFAATIVPIAETLLRKAAKGPAVTKRLSESVVSFTKNVQTLVPRRSSLSNVFTAVALDNGGGSGSGSGSNTSPFKSNTITPVKNNNKNINKNNAKINALSSEENARALLGMGGGGGGSGSSPTGNSTSSISK